MAAEREASSAEGIAMRIRDLVLDFRAAGQARVLIERWRIHCDTERPHSSLGCRPPAPETIRPPRWPSGSAALRLPAGVAEEAAMHWHSTRTTTPGQVRGRVSREDQQPCL